jgi:tRNA threonylcarbamoyladenosine biosynthesis protein TsaB
MKLLAIDTSTDACSVAVTDNQQLLAHQFEIIPRQHTQHLLPMIETTLSESKLALNDLDALALAIGPGSFTGLRIAAGVIQGLSFGLDLPVVPISTLQTLAQGIYRQTRIRNICVALDARMHQIYWGNYQISTENRAIAEAPDRVIDPQNIRLPTPTTEWIGAGSGWIAYQSTIETALNRHLRVIDTSENIKETFTPNEIRIIANRYPDAQDVAFLATEAFKKGHHLSAENVLPIYLRDLLSYSNHHNLRGTTHPKRRK